MSDTIDSEARDRIAKLYTEHRELAGDYWGPDKTNGRRSMIAGLHDRIVVLETTVERRNNTRSQECLGLAAFNSYMKKLEQEEVEMRIEKVKGKNLMAIQWVQVLGIIAVALIALLK